MRSPHAREKDLEVSNVSQEGCTGKAFGKDLHEENCTGQEGCAGKTFGKALHEKSCAGQKGGSEEGFREEPGEKYCTGMGSVADTRKAGEENAQSPGDWRKLVKRAREGDMTAKEQLLTANSGLIHMVLRRFAGAGRDMEELYQVGAIGLIRAIERFDLNTDYAFSTYAVPMIIGEIGRFLRDDGMLHVSRPIKENARKIRRVREKWEKENGYEMTMNQLVEQTGLSREEIVLAMESEAVVESIYRPVRDAAAEEQTLTLADRIEDRNVTDSRILDQITVRQMLEGLSREDRRLIELRYMQGCTQTETARKLGMNQVAVSRREKKILMSLRQKFGG